MQTSARLNGETASGMSDPLQLAALSSELAQAQQKVQTELARRLREQAEAAEEAERQRRRQAEEDVARAKSGCQGGATDCHSGADGSEATGNKLCICCETNDVDTVLVPCGHYILCQECAAELERRGSGQQDRFSPQSYGFSEGRRGPAAGGSGSTVLFSCPVCKVDVQSAVKTFCR